MPRHRHYSVAVTILLVVLAAVQARGEDFPLVVQTDALTPEEQQKKFRLPPGFEIQLVASEPDVRKPINMNFDHAGRLYFSQSVEYPYAAKEGAKPRDTVRVIEGIGADGRATKVRTAVDGLNIPIGVLPLHDRLLVFSIPNIYSCRDEDGDGVYEKREVLYGPFGRRDTHGLNNGFTRGLDGWIYACHGFANESRVQGRDGNEVVMNSGNTYRFRADGSRIEHFTHGQVNPFGLCFDPLGNLYSADCHTLPAYMLLRGAYYPSFGKPHDGLGFGPTMMSHSHDSTGIAGIIYYAAEHFPPEYRDTLFIGNPITHRVNHDKLQWHGSTPQAIEQPDFLKCDDPWFRPVDLKLGLDGALYIADFYNRIIGHYEVPLDHPQRDRERGRIWRVVYLGTPDQPVETPVLPDLTKLDLEGLIAKLGDTNFGVRTMATHELNDRFPTEAANRLNQLLAAKKLSVLQRTHAVWILPRGANYAPGSLLDDDAAAVRVHGVRQATPIVAENVMAPDARRSTNADRLLDKLEDRDPFVRRAAAEMLANADLAKATEALLDLWARSSAADANLIHSVRISLRDQFSRENAYDLWNTKRGTTRDTHRAKVAEVSLGIPSADAAAFLLAYIEENHNAVPRFIEMLGHVFRHLPAERLPEAFKLVERLRDEPAPRQRTALVAMHQALQARGMQTPETLIAWANDVATKLLSSVRERQVAQGAELAREMKLRAVRPQLEQIATGDEFPGVRPAAIDACVACDPAGSMPMLARLAASAKEPMALRQKSAQALGSINNAAAHRELVALLSETPATLAGDLAAGLASGPRAAELLVGAIETGKASAHVLHNPQVVLRLKQIQRADLQDRIATLLAALPPADERMRNVVEARIAGYAQAKTDVALGKQVFAKTCGACHKIAGQGTKIGPDLDGIGNRGVERLVEDTLDPSRNVDQAFRTTLITTDEGQSLSGLVLREEGQVVVLADNQGKEIRVAGDKVFERTVSPISPMPANVAEQVSEQDFYHLLAYLLSHARQGDTETVKQGEVLKER
ncbi:MAG: PVC-type heme-binding CxxCH protein [Pirellulales bacterium]